MNLRRFAAWTPQSCRILYFFIDGKPCEPHPDLKRELAADQTLELAMPDSVKTMIAICEVEGGAHCPLAFVPVD